MANGFVHDGSEQYAYLELNSVLDAIKAGRLDPTHVYRTPADEPGTQTDRLSCRAHKQLIDGVDTIVRAGKYQSRSEVLRQGILYVLAVEKGLEDIDLPLDPVIIWAKRQATLAVQKAIDGIVEDSLYRTGHDEMDGDLDRDELWNDLMSVMDYCKSRGWNKRVENVRRALTKIHPAGIE